MEATTHFSLEFFDLQGQTLFHLKKHLIALHATFDGVSPTNEETVLFTIKKSFSIGKAKLNITFRNAADGKQISLALRGDFFDRSVRGGVFFDNILTCNNRRLGTGGDNTRRTRRPHRSADLARFLQCERAGVRKADVFLEYCTGRGYLAARGDLRVS